MKSKRSLVIGLGVLGASLAYGLRLGTIERSTLNYEENLNIRYNVASSSHGPDSHLLGLVGLVLLVSKRRRKELKD